MLMINFSDSKFEAGVDEAGRGSLAGPITAAAVILPRDYRNDALDDSKRLSEKKRIELKGIIERDSIDFAVFSVAPSTIDKINILNSTFKAMHGALNSLKIIPSFISVDGNRFKKYKNVIFFMGNNGKKILNETLKEWDLDYDEKKSLTSDDSFILNIKKIRKKVL